MKKSPQLLLLGRLSERKWMRAIRGFNLAGGGLRSNHPQIFWLFGFTVVRLKPLLFALSATADGEHHGQMMQKSFSDQILKKNWNYVAWINPTDVPNRIFFFFFFLKKKFQDWCCSKVTFIQEHKERQSAVRIRLFFSHALQTIPPSPTCMHTGQCSM